jgi:hypothetical protein
MSRPTFAAEVLRVDRSRRSPRVATALGDVCCASGVLGLLAGVVTLAYPAAVPDDRWSHPFGFDVGLAMGIGLAVTHLMTGLGVRGLQLVRAGLGSRAEGAGLAVALTGFTLLAVCELAGGAIGKAGVDETRATVVDTAFAVASLLTAVGSVVAVPGVRRGGSAAARWLLASALVMMLLVTPANISGNEVLRMLSLMLWSLCFVPLGAAVRRLAAAI